MIQAFEMEIEFISILIITFFYFPLEHHLNINLHLYQKSDSFGFIYQKYIYNYWGQNLKKNITRVGL